MTGGFDPEYFARDFHRFIETVNRLQLPEPSPLRDHLAKHFGRDPGELPVLAEELAPAEHPNLQLALDELVKDGNWNLCGLPLGLRQLAGFSLGSLASDRGVNDAYRTSRPGPVEYVNVPVGLGETLPCAQLALYLGSWLDAPIAALVVAGDERHQDAALTVEVLATERDAGRVFLDVLRQRRDSLNVYRGKNMSYVSGPHGGMRLDFLDVPVVERAQVILPPRDLEAIEQHTLGIAEHAEVLREAGRHVKRGLLLYGPPGTGKTMTVHYLCNRMPDRTTIIVNGGPSITRLGQAIALARSLEPSMLVIEDVDLIGANRVNARHDTNPVLFQLLNEMDNVPEQDDVIFIMTTNRLDLLEPSLAARPGRIDHAVEIDLPDTECRRRLFELYLRDVPAGTLQIAGLVDALHGISAAFVKELVRRATVIAAMESLDGRLPPLQTRHLTAALDALGASSTSVLRTLLGVTEATGA